MPGRGQDQQDDRGYNRGTAAVHEAAFGDWNEELECDVGMTTVLWSVDSLDWKLKNKNKIVKRVLKDVEDGDIILMHDIFPTSVQAALELIDTLTRQGYTFVTVDELLID